MSRASRFVGLVPVGFLAFTAAVAAATVVGGWTITTPLSAQGSPAGLHAASGYGIDEVNAR